MQLKLVNIQEHYSLTSIQFVFTFILANNSPINTLEQIHAVSQERPLSSGISLCWSTKHSEYPLFKDNVLHRYDSVMENQNLNTHKAIYELLQAYRSTPHDACCNKETPVHTSYSMVYHIIRWDI